MAYMVYQRYATAIREAYGAEVSQAELEGSLADAGRARAWLESLPIEEALRASLVEPIAVIEDALAGLIRRRSRAT